MGEMRKQVGWNVGHNLTIGGRELAYSSSEHLQGSVTDVQVEQLTKLLSDDNSTKFLCDDNSQSYCPMTIPQVFSRVVSMEEAVAYTSCSEG